MEGFGELALGLGFGGGAAGGWASSPDHILLENGDDLLLEDGDLLLTE